MTTRQAVISIAALGRDTPYAGILRIALQVFMPEKGTLGPELVTRFKFDPMVSSSCEGEAVRWWTRESPDANAIMSDQGAAHMPRDGFEEVITFLRANEVTHLWYDYRYDNIPAFLHGVERRISDESLKYIHKSIRTLDYGSTFEFMGVKGEPTLVPMSRLNTHKWAARTFMDCLRRYKEFNKKFPIIEDDEI